MKKSILLLMMCTVQTGHASSPYFTGFFASIGGGGTIARYSIDQTFIAGPKQQGPNSNQFELPVDMDIQGENGMGVLGLGYSHVLHDHFVMGAAITAGITHAEASHLNENTFFSPNQSGPPSYFRFASTVEATLRNDFALLFRPGYLFKERTQLYALIGPRWGNFETSLETAYNVMNVKSGSVYSEESGYQIGFTAGIGMEHMVSQHFSIGLEYDFTTYGNIDTPENDIFVTVQGGDGAIADHPEVNAYTNTVSLALSYHF